MFIITMQLKRKELTLVINKTLKIIKTFLVLLINIYLQILNHNY